jgi:hypothetical protein
VARRDNHSGEDASGAQWAPCATTTYAMTSTIKSVLKITKPKMNPFTILVCAGRRARPLAGHRSPGRDRPGAVLHRGRYHYGSCALVRAHPVPPAVPDARARCRGAAVRRLSRVLARQTGERTSAAARLLSRVPEAPATVVIIPCGFTTILLSLLLGNCSEYP